MTDLEKLNIIYEDYREYFFGAFHSLLWEIIIKRTWTDTITLDLNIGKNIELVIVSLKNSGHTPTGVYFQTYIEYKKAGKICDVLNKHLFKQTESESLKISLNSLKQQLYDRRN